MNQPPESSEPNPLERFSDRVADYVKYRPTYPLELIQFLASISGLNEMSRIADVGSGTGIFTTLLLGTKATVYAVEPNEAMRQAAEAMLKPYPNFVSVNGTAEATQLRDKGVSLVTCAQAFHWFDPDATRVEFRRILVPGGPCALVWNTAIADKSAFAIGYEKIKEGLGTDFKRVRHEGVAKAERCDRFFGSGNWERHCFGNSQRLDLAGLMGRMLSSSYAPKEGQRGFEAMREELKSLFETTQQRGLIQMDYNTELFLGRLT